VDGLQERFSGECMKFMYSSQFEDASVHDQSGSESYAASASKELESSTTTEPEAMNDASTDCVDEPTE